MHIQLATMHSVVRWQHDEFSSDADMMLYFLIAVLHAMWRHLESVVLWLDIISSTFETKLLYVVICHVVYIDSTLYISAVNVWYCSPILDLLTAIDGVACACEVPIITYKSPLYLISQMDLNLLSHPLRYSIATKAVWHMMTLWHKMPSTSSALDERKRRSPVDSPHKGPV